MSHEPNGAGSAIYGRPDIALREVADVWRAVSQHFGVHSSFPKPDLASLREQIYPIWPKGINVRLFELGFETTEIRTYSKWCSDLTTPKRPHQSSMLWTQEQRAEGGQHHCLVKELFERRRYFALNDPAFKDHDLFQKNPGYCNVPLWFRVAQQPIAPHGAASADQPDCLCASFAIQPDHWESLLTWFVPRAKTNRGQYGYTEENETPTTLAQMTMWSSGGKFAWRLFKESQVVYPPRMESEIVFNFPDRFPCVA